MGSIKSCKMCYIRCLRLILILNLCYVNIYCWAEHWGGIKEDKGNFKRNYLKFIPNFPFLYTSTDLQYSNSYSSAELIWKEYKEVFSTLTITENPQLTMAARIGISIAKQCCHKVWSHMTMLLSNGSFNSCW